MSKISRSSFLQLVTAGSVLPAIAPSITLSTTNYSLKDRLGLASYTLRKFNLDQVIAMTNTLGLQHIALKSMHMPMESTEEEIKAIAKKIRAAGINLYGAGVVYMKSADAVHNAFRYAQAADLKTIIGVPNHDLLSLVSEKVEETDIKVAIHNHGPGDKLYPTAESILEKIDGLDRRVGVCLDIGHVTRLDLNPIKAIKICEGRLYDVHLKDVSAPTTKGHSVEIGRGIMNILGCLEALKSVHYQGILGLEYEKDGDDPMAGLAESVGYSKGVMDSM